MRVIFTLLEILIGSLSNLRTTQNVHRNMISIYFGPVSEVHIYAINKFCNNSFLVLIINNKRGITDTAFIRVMQKIFPVGCQKSGDLTANEMNSR